MTMSRGSLPRFSSIKDEIEDTNNDNSDDLVPEALSSMLASLNDQAVSQAVSHSDYKHLGLDDLSRISRSMLMDKNLEVSKFRPFFWNLVETYVDRFQVLPFDAIKALFSYLELHQYPKEQLRDLVEQLERLYETQHGRPMRESERQPVSEGNSELMLDDEINQLRETLKYAAIVGERLDGKT